MLSWAPRTPPQWRLVSVPERTDAAGYVMLELRKRVGDAATKVCLEADSSAEGALLHLQVRACGCTQPTPACAQLRLHAPCHVTAVRMFTHAVQEWLWTHISCRGDSRRAAHRSLHSLQGTDAWGVCKLSLVLIYSLTRDHCTGPVV